MLLRSKLLSCSCAKMVKIFIAFLILFYTSVFADLSNIKTCYNDPASLQLPNYSQKTQCPLKCLTTGFGARVDETETNTLNSKNLMRNRFLIDIVTHVMRERIPERHVHTKGAGGFGYFEVTHNITKYCKAKLFSKIGKITPLVIRFSHANLDKGEADTSLDVRGFSIKFYTEKGNFDIAGFNTPIYIYKEPLLFQQAGKVFRRNAVTNLKDPNETWDFICNRPESLSFWMYLLGVTGITDGFICMPGFGIHTYQVYNNEGESYFVKWHILPTCEVKKLSLEEAAKLSCMDPDHSVRQLYNAIARRNYPTWILGIQVITKEEIDSTPEFDFFDVTKLWPESKYPVIPVGKIVLNRNPKNYFVDVEQVGFCPGNFPEGILGGPDNMFTVRMLAYREAQLYRLSTNFDNIPVNHPHSQVNSYNRDGTPPNSDNGGDGPNYFFNGYKGPSACKEKNRPELITIKQFDDTNNFDQIAEIYKNMTQEQRNEMVKTIVSSLSRTIKDLQIRAVDLLGCIDLDLKFRVTIALSVAAENCPLS